MMSLIILILTLLGMIFEDKIGIKLCVIGCVGALALIITGVIHEKNALKSIDLKTIFLFGGTLSLAAALQETGAGEEIATAVIGILGKNPSPYVLTFVVFMLCCVLTNFMSDTATTALWFQSAYQLPQRLELTRVQYLWHVLSVVHVHTPHLSVCLPTQWSLQPGGYTFKDYAKAGIPLIVVATIVVWSYCRFSIRSSHKNGWEWVNNKLIFNYLQDLY